jgi:hypothetical protein
LLKRIGGVRIVFCKRPRDPWKNLVAIVTSEYRLPARDIVAIHERRWTIEISHPNCRSSASLYRGELAA